jgi:hypothetical protein
MDVRNPDPNSPSTIKTATEARQGVTGQGVSTVLMISLGTIIVVFALLWLLYFGR